MNNITRSQYYWCIILNKIIFGGLGYITRKVKYCRSCVCKGYLNISKTWMLWLVLWREKIIVPTYSFYIYLSTHNRKIASKKKIIYKSPFKTILTLWPTFTNMLAEC